MKKFLIFCMATLVAVSLQSCGGGDDNGGGGGGGEPDPDPNPIVETSVQAANKTVSIPAENFPAIDIYDEEGPVTSFTLIEGYYNASKNGVEFDGDKFATGVELGEEDVITISQGGTKLVEFAPKTGGAGTLIKLLGIGSTSDLTAAEGIGRGIYTFTIPEGATDANGMIKGGTIFTGGNVNNVTTKITLEGGVDYLLRRDRLDPDLALDVEGWAYQPADLGAGFVCENPNMLISIYPAAAKDLSAEEQEGMALYSAQPLPSSGHWDFILQRFVKKVADNNDDRYYRVQGCGNISCWFRIGDGVNRDDFDFSSNGIPADHVNQNPLARVFGPTVQFALHVSDKSSGFTDADLATAEQVGAFLSDEGLDPGDKYVVMKVLNPEEAVNTQEELELIWKRKAEKTNKIRFEGVAYDAQNGYIVLTAGMTVRTSNDEGAFN